MPDVQSVLLGEDPADMVLVDGRVLSPERRAVLDRDLAVTDGRIAGLTTDAEDVIGPDTRIVDVDGSIVSPGWIDGHNHADLHQAVETAYHRALAGGTTSIVSEVAVFGPAFGAEGVEVMLDATAELPLRIFPTVPPQPVFDMFEAPWADDEDLADLVECLDRDRVVGVGETAWVRVVGRETPAESLYRAAHDRNLVVSGHGAGCRGDRLSAFATTVDNDHESIAGDGVIERAERGIHVIGRYGTIRDDLPAIADGDHELDASELSLSTDGMWPREWVEEGHMDAVLRRAHELGIDPIDAVVMATLTPARHFGIEELGTLRPGTPADLTIFDDLGSFDVQSTVVEGSIVYEGGSVPIPDPPSYRYPDRFTDSVDLDISSADLSLPAEVADDGTVTAIANEPGLGTSRTTVEPSVEDGELAAAPPDLAKVALFDRHPDRDRGGFVGFLSGFGLERGAVATTVTWETAGAVGVGVHDEDIRHAFATIEGMGGGWAVVDDGTVTATLGTPVGATASRRPVEETAERYDAVETALYDLGADQDRPMLTIQTLAFVGVPSLKLTFDGYADVRTGEVIGL